MKAPFKRSFFFFIIVLNLAVAALYSQISTNTDFQPQVSGQLSELLSGKSANVDEITLSLPETDLPAALGVAEQLSFKALHNDIPMSPEAVARVRQTIENRMQKAKSVSLQSSEQCPVSVPARRLNVAGTEITVPSYFVTDQPIIISQTPTGEAGTFFPTISVTVAAAPGSKLHGSLLLNGKPFPLKQESFTTLAYRPIPSAENALSIGTHTAQITVTDARGRAASATWSFTVGVKPAAQPAIDPSWPVVGSFSIPLSHLIGISTVNGNVQVIVYQTPNGELIQKLIASDGSGPETLSVTTQDPFWLSTFFTPKRDGSRTIAFSPRTNLALPGNTLTFSYTYYGPGTVEEENWTVKEGSSQHQSSGPSIMWKIGKRYVSVELSLTVTDDIPPGDSSKAVIIASKGITPVLPDTSFYSLRHIAISRLATGTLPFHLGPGVAVGDKRYALQVGETVDVGGCYVSLDSQEINQIGGNTQPKIEDPTAIETRLVFSQPGWVEYRHTMNLRLSYEGETYQSVVDCDELPLLGLFQASATVQFSKLPAGIIAGTKRKATIDKVILSLNGETKSFSAPNFDEPWTLAQSTVNPASYPLALSGLRILIPENIDPWHLFDEYSIILDPLIGEEDPQPEVSFTPHVHLVQAPGAIIQSPAFSTLKSFFIPYYLDEPLLETTIRPETDMTILENQQMDFTTVVTPAPGKGTGEITQAGGKIDLLDGYEVKRLEMLSWAHAHESEMPSEELKKPKRTNDVQWSYSFKPDKGTGTYFIGNGCYATVYEPETETEASVGGGGQRTVTVIPGLKILSPKANFAYPQV